MGPRISKYVLCNYQQFFQELCLSDRILKAAVHVAGDREGHLCEAVQLIDLARDCHEAGITCQNITPSNLLISNDGFLRIIDVGCDMVPFTEEDFKRRVSGVQLSLHAHWKSQ